ncbi:uncharacterized protein EV420DRAFT_243886 [Desarmillaria tabescens]|uniref:Uncharacterized protein n=1 Tax=Armillaria tabescens TaxID=1929756 RepID=A0AA39KHL2_ARMTA|nr:uncharacterized protein EV420DRAFT_243886 [Desarmillaria tabescens]KAK0459969.1 hypothetical protein EV420DRAFT_243886 [Desarmillaria tabescens]
MLPPFHAYLTAGILCICSFLSRLAPSLHPLIYSLVCTCTLIHCHRFLRWYIVSNYQRNLGAADTTSLLHHPGGTISTVCIGIPGTKPAKPLDVFRLKVPHTLSFDSQPCWRAYQS